MGESERWWKSDHLGKMSDYQNDRPESRKCPSGQHNSRPNPWLSKKKIVLRMLISNSHELFHEWDTLNIIHSGLFNLKSIEICKCQITKTTDQNRGGALQVSIIWRTEVPDYQRKNCFANVSFKQPWTLSWMGYFGHNSLRTFQFEINRNL